jgi:hypothetical protein
MEKLQLRNLSKNNKAMRKLFFAMGSIVLMFSACTYESVEPIEVVVTDSVISYSQTIAPLVSTECSSVAGCHESGSQDGDFTKYEGLKEKATTGSLFNRVVTLKDMPQKGSGFQLTDKERSYFAAWIAQGFPNN